MFYGNEGTKIEGGKKRLENARDTRLLLSVILWFRFSDPLDWNFSFF